MLTRAFNCPKCKKPFGCAEGESRKPFLDVSQLGCVSCIPTFSTEFSQPGLMDFLRQPAFKRTDEGYDYTLPINEPVCFGCDHAINVFDGELAFVANCGHYICQGCDRKRPNTGGFVYIGAPPLTCTICRTAPNGPKPFPADTFLAAFSSEIKNRSIQELNERFNDKESQNKALVAEKARLAAMAEKIRLEAMAEKARLEAIIAKQGEERGNGAMKNCGDCGIERPVELLYKCKGCDTINCGNCCFDAHREHSVEKLLGIELDQLQKQNDKRYTEILGGLHGNLKHIQTTIDSAVDEVMEAGKDLLTNIAKCTKYKEAEVIVAKVEKAADKFEEHCEVYIPIARELATRLTELREELKEVQKK